jgi:hypothetical protein
MENRVKAMRRKETGQAAKYWGLKHILSSPVRKGHLRNAHTCPLEL